MENHDERQLILYKAIMLFASQGYEHVSLRQIADAAGVKTSEIFEYYQNKEAVLHEIYNFYQKNIHAKRLTPDAYEPILQNGSAEDIVNILNYPLPEHIMLEMFYANVIVWTRRYLDPVAKEVYLKTIVQESYAYIELVLNRGIKIGRLQMEHEDVKVFAAIALGIRENSANAAVIDPNQRKWRIKEIETNRMLSKLLNVKPLPLDTDNPTDISIPEQAKQSSYEYLINSSVKNESYTASQYYYLADVAKRKGGTHSIVSLLTEMAENCIGNVIMLNMMAEARKPEGHVPIDLSLNNILNEAIKNESWKATSKYVSFEKTAQEEAFTDLAVLFREIIDISNHHEKLCNTALKEHTAQ